MLKLGSLIDWCLSYGTILATAATFAAVVATLAS